VFAFESAEASAAPLAVEGIRGDALEIEAEALQGGAAGFLRKPFSDQALVDLIHRAIA
jgi:FixJ family two-component response regulator